MRITTIFIVALMLLISTNTNAQEASFWLRNINYIDVISGEAKKGNILLEDGKIKKIAKRAAASPNPDDIDGTGKWLIPGLVDAHIHLFQSGGLYTRPDALDLTQYRSYEKEQTWLKENANDLLKRYLRLGITTVVDVGGPMANFTIRDSLKGQNGYPSLYMTGPLVSTYQPPAFQIEDPPIVKVTSKEEAIALVQKQVPLKPDFIKIWYIVLPTQTAESTYEIVEATIQESHKNGLQVAVHATQLNTAKLALKAGADILVHSVDDPIDEDFITLLKKNNARYVPTLMVNRKYIETFSDKLEISMEDFLYSNPTPLGSFFDSAHFPEKIFESYVNYLPQMHQRLATQDSIRAANLKLLMKHDIIISTGTDAGNIGTLHASSYYQELDFMKAAGLSNAEILAASTINGAKLLGKESEFGSIEEGKAADLVLLNANPLEDLEALKDIQFVIKKGTIFAKDSILIDSPEQLVQQQLNGYNAGNIDAFLAPYSEDVEIYNFPNEITGKGKTNIRPQYENMFKNLPDLHCELTNRMVYKDTVIDYERITGIPNRASFEAIAIYKIKDGKIAKVYFIQ